MCAWKIKPTKRQQKQKWRLANQPNQFHKKMATASHTQNKKKSNGEERIPIILHAAYDDTKKKPRQIWTDHKRMVGGRGGGS